MPLTRNVENLEQQKQRYRPLVGSVNLDGNITNCSGAVLNTFSSHLLCNTHNDTFVLCKKKKEKRKRNEQQHFLALLSLQSDKGGSKQMLQLKWTSLLRARLYCGQAESKLYFSELVDVAIVEDKLWSDTKVYALFRNEW